MAASTSAIIAATSADVVSEAIAAAMRFVESGAYRPSLQALWIRF
jgi:hypothetical protein